MISIIFGFIISIAHYFSEHFCLRCGSMYRNKIISFSAGISVSYIFLDLFPTFSEGAAEISQFLFLSLLSGFVIFHLIETYIYGHSPEDRLLRKLAFEDTIISFIYHFVVGMILVNIITRDFTEGILFFIPVLFYTTVSTLPVDMTQFKTIKIFLASSTLLGVLFAQFIYTEMSSIIYFLLMGFIIGALSFTVMRHSIPRGRQSKPIFFILGVILYSAFIFLLSI